MFPADIPGLQYWPLNVADIVRWSSKASCPHQKGLSTRMLLNFDVSFVTEERNQNWPKEGFFMILAAS